MISKRIRASRVRIGVLVVVSVLLSSALYVSIEKENVQATETADYVDWGIPKTIDGNLWINQQDTDFSLDPKWVTNNDTNYYWNKTDQYYYMAWVGGSDEYAYAPTILNATSSRVRVEFDVKPIQMGLDANLPIALMEKDMEYRTDGSIQFFFGRNSTANYTALESYNGTGISKITQKADGFSLDVSYHVVLLVDYSKQTVKASVSKTGSASELYNLSLTGIGGFEPLPRVGTTTVGVTGGTAIGILDNFIAGSLYEGPGDISITLSKDVYYPGEAIRLNATFFYEMTAWTKLTSAPYARHDFSSAWNDRDRFLIVMGGEYTYANPDYDPRAETFIYYAGNDTWVKMKDAPIKRHSHGCVWDPNVDRMILYGGWDSTSAGYHFTKQTWAYDPWNDTWTKRTDGPVERDDMWMVYDTVSKTVLMCGGYNWGFLSDLWEYNYTADKWTQLKSMPTAKVGHAAVWDSSNDRMIVTMGEDASAPIKNNLTYAYYRNNDTWISLKTGSPRRAELAAAWDPNTESMLLVGGWGPGSSLDSDFQIYTDLWAYQSEKNSWVNLGRMPIPERWEACAHWDTKGNRMLVYGGGGWPEGYPTNFATYNDMWAYGSMDYDQSEVPLSLEIITPSNETLDIWTNKTDINGNAGFDLTLPSDAEVGTYNCTITSSRGDRIDFNFTVEEYLGGGEFHIKSVSLSGDYGSSGYVEAKVVLENPQNSTGTGILVLQVMNPKKTPIPPAINESISVPAGSEQTIILRVDLPSNTREGQYNVQVDLMTGEPMDGGSLMDYRAESFTV